MKFAVGVIIVMGVLVAGILGLIGLDPGYLLSADMDYVRGTPIMAEVEPEAEIEMGPQTHTILIAEGSSVVGCEEDDSCYIPHTLTINSGDTIRWDNPDAAAHTITSVTDMVPDGLFDSGLIMIDASFEYTFEESGTYDYFCIVHPWMASSIQVN